MKRQAKIKSNSVKTYVMFGFEESDPQNTAYLKVGRSADSICGAYSIVGSAENATKFPEKNVCKTKGFGTPWQWAEFFAEEEELQDWNFHPVLCK